MSFGPVYEVADATYIVKAGSPVTTFQQLDQAGVKVAAVTQHHDHARRDCASQEREGDGVSDL